MAPLTHALWTLRNSVFKFAVSPPMLLLLRMSTPEVTLWKPCRAIMAENDGSSK